VSCLDYIEPEFRSPALKEPGFFLRFEFDVRVTARHESWQRIL